MNIRSGTHPDFWLTMSKRGWWSLLGRVIAVCLLAGVLTGCVNHFPEYSIGGGATIRVPTPDGFKPLGDHDPHLRSLIKGNRDRRILVEYYLTKSEFNAMIHGNDTDRNKDLILYASPDVFSNDQFSELTNAISKKYSGVVPMIIDPRQKPDDGGVLQATVTRPKGVFLRMPDAVGVTLVNRVLVNDGVATATRVMVMVHVRNRVVLAVVGAPGDGQSNIRWAQQIGKQWSQAILEANR